MPASRVFACRPRTSEAEFRQWRETKNVHVAGPGVDAPWLLANTKLNRLLEHAQEQPQHHEQAAKQ